MLPFASYVQRRYHRSTGWNDDNRYSNLTYSAKAILDFEVPRGLHFHVSKSPNSLFNTTYSLNALPSLHGSLGYIFTSCDLDIQSSANVKFRDVVSGFKIYDRPKPPELLGDETWLGGERVDIPQHYLLYGRLYVPSGTLDGLYSTRIGPSTQVAVALRSELGPPSTSRKTRKGDYPDDSHIAFSLQHDRGKWGSELTYNAKNGMWGGQILYNFGKGKGEDKGETLALPTKRVDEDDAMNGGLKGRLSAGAEVLFSLRDKSGGITTALRFTTVPDATPASAQPTPGTVQEYHPQPPTTITAILNPLLGHIQAAYASRVSRDLALCSRFNFNVYSYESEWSMGAEWWIRPRRNASDPPASIDMLNEERKVQGVLKASVSTNQTASLLWEGRLRKVLVGLGVVSNLANRSEPIKAMGLELAYFTSEV